MALSDEKIARAAQLRPIGEIAAALGIPDEAVYRYGDFKAKIDVQKIFRQPEDNARRGRLILVTAINPTPAGEGKTTVSIGLADALRRIGKKTAVAVREPSLGPVFGIKGGAAGGGYAQVVPMDEINLHFTGDLHAITAANNLLAAMLDNHIFHGNALKIHPKKVKWRRVIDINDRQLRSIVSGAGGAADGVMRADGFDITVASEVMAVLCLAENIDDLKTRLGKIIAAYDVDNRPVTAAQLKAHGAMAALLKDAVRPNLVQTLEGTPAFVHGGPFANIAHGCNSVIATKTALRLADYTVTEAGFGADLGAEKFCNIKCRQSGLRPDAAVLVATVRALKYNGGAAKNDLAQENLPALEKGLPNLLRHIGNIKNGFNIPVIVAANRFATDSAAELATLQAACENAGAAFALCEVWEKGGAGGVELAEKLVQMLPEKSALRFTYEDSDTLPEKIRKVAQKIYGAKDVSFSDQALQDLEKFTETGLGNLPVCMAKTQYSFSDNAKLLGAPEGFTVHVRAVEAAAGAGFIIALTGSIMRMPGLPKVPAAENIDIDESGEISGLF